MPKDQASDEGSKSRSFGPYPSLFNAHDGRIGVSRAGPSSRTGLVIPQLHAPHQQSVADVGPQLSYSYPSHLRLGDSLGSTYSHPSGSHWMQYTPPTYSNSPIPPTESIALFQRALTGSQPPSQSAPVVNVVHQPPPSERQRGERRSFAATNFGAIPSVYDVYAQVPPSCSPHVPVETYPVSASTWPVQDPGAITSSLPLPPTLAVPPAPPAQLLVENPSQFGSGSMPEPPLSFLYNPYPQPSLFDLSVVMPNPPLTPSSSWKSMNQSLPYPNINTDPQPQLPAAPIIDILDILSKSSFEWTVEDLELLSNPSLLTSSYVPSTLISLAQPHIPPQLPPQSSDKQPVRDPQHQWSHFGDYAQPGQVVEAPVSLADSSADNIVRSSRSFLQNAHHFRTGDWHVNNHNTTNTTVVTSGKIDGWEILQKHVARNALHNSRARYDAPKCDEDTRVEVIAEIMGLIKDRAHPQRVLCMTGAAGSGKSAIQQSIAVCCAKDNILGGAYFISAADSSRNTASTIVPTIAYQLGLKDSALQRSIAAAVEHYSLIFCQSLETQMDVLIARPFERMCRSRECDIATFPYAILIDGLDECQGELINTNGAENSKAVAKRRLGEDSQAELLSALKNSLLKHDLPFRIFIASRPELAIHTALGTGGSLHGLAYHIPLSDEDKYDATEDMRRYLRRRFEDIGLRINRPHWFTEGDIDTLVQAGSGQFVYVATVYKYVSEPRASPVQRLKTVLNWTPEQATRPFEALDTLYRNILLSAKEAYEAVDTHSGRDFLLLLKIYLLVDLDTFEWEYGGESTDSNIVTALLNLESDASEILTLDLRSLVYLQGDEPPSLHLVAYHKSLYDFMNEKSRAKDLFVPTAPIRTHIAKCSMQHIIESPEPELDTPNLAHWSDRSAPFSQRCVSLAISCLADDLTKANLDDELVDFTHKGGWNKIDTVLCKHSGFDIIFADWEDAEYWAGHLVGVAKILKKCRPEAGETMCKYAEKWKNITQKHSSDSDSD